MSENELAPGTFVKLYGGILKSTVWVGRPYYVKLVWLTMLVEADAKGFVASSVVGLAKDAEVSPEQCREALLVFLSPDPESRTKEHEGRRIVEVDGGWRLLNHKKYRDMRTPQQVDAARRQKKSRARKKTPAADGAVTGNVTRVTRVTRHAGHAKTVTPVTSHASHNRSRSSRPDHDPSGSAEPNQPAKPEQDLTPKIISRGDDFLSGIPEDLSGRTRASPSAPVPVSPVSADAAAVAALRVEPIIASKLCPPEWQPKDHHRDRAAQPPALEFDAQLDKFRAHEWPQPYTDWDRRFTGWLIKAREYAQTASFQRYKRDQLQPNHGLTGFEGVTWEGGGDAGSG